MLRAEFYYNINTEQEGRELLSRLHVQAMGTVDTRVKLGVIQSLDDTRHTCCVISTLLYIITFYTSDV